MKTIYVVIFLSMAISGCQYSKSAKKDLLSGLSSTGNIISCEDVYLTADNERTSRNSFVYGETFLLSFSDVRGFAKENGNVFPGMTLVVIGSAGDTLMATGDLMSKYPEGMSFTPLLLTADLTVASPIRSNGDYTALVNIWDRKGKGTYKTRFDFNVSCNDKIIVEPSGVTYNEIYLFSQGSDRVITDNKLIFNDNIFIIIEGLKGFKESGGMVFPGLSIKAADSEMNIILESDDLFVDYSASGLAAADLTERVSAHFSVPGPRFNNPLHCELIVWDKKSEARIKVVTDMVME